MKVKVYLYPHYVTISSSWRLDGRLFNFLASQGVELEAARWNGDLKSLPTTPSLIRASSMMDCGWVELGKRCAELGHFCFYKNEVILANGTGSQELLIGEVKRFLARQAAA